MTALVQDVDSGQSCVRDSGEEEERGVCVCMYVQPFQSCLTLCDLMDYNPTGSSVHGILQARILEWIVMPFSRGSSQPRDGTHVSYVYCIGRWVLYY